jgi:hypothetical protein
MVVAQGAVITIQVGTEGLVVVEAMRARPAELALRDRTVVMPQPPHRALVVAGMQEQVHLPVAGDTRTPQEEMVGLDNSLVGWLLTA